MKKYIGTKIIKATAMTRLEYSTYRGWELPKNEDHLANKAGFLVEYQDGGRANDERHSGYISWSPADVFYNTYQASGTLSFGHAIEFIKQGYKIARTGWNGAGMYAYYVPARVDNEGNEYRAHLMLKTAQGDFASWTASTSDQLADDWFIVEE